MTDKHFNQPDFKFQGEDRHIFVNNKRVKGITFNGRQVKAMAYLGDKQPKQEGVTYYSATPDERYIFSTQRNATNLELVSPPDGNNRTDLDTEVENIVFQDKPTAVLEKQYIDIEGVPTLIINRFSALNQYYGKFKEKDFTDRVKENKYDPLNILKPHKVNHLSGQMKYTAADFIKGDNTLWYPIPTNPHEADGLHVQLTLENHFKISKTPILKMRGTEVMENSQPNQDGVYTAYPLFKPRTQTTNVIDYTTLPVTVVNTKELDNAQLLTHSCNECYLHPYFIPYKLDKYCLPMKLAVSINYTKSGDTYLKRRVNLGQIRGGYNANNQATYIISSRRRDNRHRYTYQYQHYSPINPESNENVAVTTSLFLYGGKYNVGTVYPMRFITPDTPTRTNQNVIPLTNGEVLEDRQATPTLLQYTQITSFQSGIFYGKKANVPSYDPIQMSELKYYYRSPLTVDVNRKTENKGDKSNGLGYYRTFCGPKLPNVESLSSNPLVGNIKIPEVAKTDPRSFISLTAVGEDRVWEKCIEHIVTSKEITLITDDKRNVSYLPHEDKQPIGFYTKDGLEMEVGLAAHQYQLKHSLRTAAFRSLQLYCGRRFPNPTIMDEDVIVDFLDRLLDSTTGKQVRPTHIGHDSSKPDTLPHEFNNLAVLFYKSFIKGERWSLAEVTDDKIKASWNEIGSKPYDKGRLDRFLVYLYNRFMWNKNSGVGPCRALYALRWSDYVGTVISEHGIARMGPGKVDKAVFPPDFYFNEESCREVYAFFQKNRDLSKYYIQYNVGEEYCFQNLDIKSKFISLKDINNGVLLNRIEVLRNERNRSDIEKVMKIDHLFREIHQTVVQETGYYYPFGLFMANIYDNTKGYASPIYRYGVTDKSYCAVYIPFNFENLVIDVLLEPLFDINTKHSRNILKGTNIKKIPKGTVLQLEWERLSRTSKNNTTDKVHYRYGDPVRNKRLYLLPNGIDKATFTDADKTFLCEIGENEIIDI